MHGHPRAPSICAPKVGGLDHGVVSWVREVAEGLVAGGSDSTKGDGYSGTEQAQPFCQKRWRVKAVSGSLHSHVCPSWRDQLLSLRKDSSECRKKGKWIDNWRKVFPAVCPWRQEDNSRTSGAPLKLRLSLPHHGHSQSLVLTIHISLPPHLPPCFTVLLLLLFLTVWIPNLRSCWLTLVVVKSLSRIWLCDPVDCSTPGSSALHYLSEFAQIHDESVMLFNHFFCLQSFPASGSFPMNQLFASGGQSTRASASASVLPVTTQELISFGIGWFDLPVVQVTLKSLLQHHNSKASILQHSAFFMI